MKVDYEYKAIDSSGNLVSGKKNVEDEISLKKILLTEKLKLVSADKISGKWQLNLRKIFFSFGRVSEHDKIIMFRNLGAMLDAGLPLTRAISVMHRQAHNKTFKNILSSLNDDVKKGSSFSDALGKFLKIFNSLMVSMVKAGEESGNLVNSMRVTADQMEKNYLLKKKVRGAMVYPGVIISIMILIGFFMMIYVVPTLTSTFSELGVVLPASTQFIIDVSDFLQNNLLLTVFIVLLLVFCFSIFIKTIVGQRFIDFILIKIPVLSEINREINSARTGRTLSALIAAGVPFIRALEITKEVLQNSYYKEIIEKAEKNVQMGLPLSKIFAENDKLFPNFVSEMMLVGEETGELGQMLGEVANFYENEVDEKMKNISTVIEPALMVIVGIAVGFFAISMIGPMYSLVENI